MESLFPAVFFLDHFAKIILQAAAAFVFLYEARRAFAAKKDALIAGAHAVIGILLGVGFLTQGAALLGIIAITVNRIRKTDSVFSNMVVAVLAFAILAFLFFSGPSGLAFDLPY